MREQTTERIAFSYEEKKKILKKSNGKCAHCGQTLKLNEATIDHVIPVSKGGTNDSENLVALCSECNYEKNDDIINPEAYFKYLREEFKTALKVQHDAYCEDVSWLTTKQYIKEDRMEVPFTTRAGVLQGHNKRRGQFVEVTCIKQTAILQKARYTDLEEINDYLEKYHKKIGLDTTEIRESISKRFSIGCIYILRKGAEIIALFPVSIVKRTFDNGTSAYLLSFSGIPVLYQKSEYAELIEKCIRIINKGLVLGNGKNIAVYEIHHPENDDFLGNIVERLSSFGACMEYNQGSEWNHTIFNQRWDFTGVEKDYAANPYEDLEYYSKSIERIMRLAPANKEVPKRSKQDRTHKKNATLARQRRQINRDIDEYDERFYQCR